MHAFKVFGASLILFFMLGIYFLMMNVPLHRIEWCNALLQSSEHTHTHIASTGGDSSLRPCDSYFVQRHH